MYILLLIIIVLLVANMSPAGDANLYKFVAFLMKGALLCVVLLVGLFFFDWAMRDSQRKKEARRRSAESSEVARMQKVYASERESAERKKAWWADFHALHPNVPLPTSVTAK